MITHARRKELNQLKKDKRLIHDFCTRYRQGDVISFCADFVIRFFPSYVFLGTDTINGAIRNCLAGCEEEIKNNSYQTFKLLYDESIVTYTPNSTCEKKKNRTFTVISAGIAFENQQMFTTGISELRPVFEVISSRGIGIVEFGRAEGSLPSARVFTRVIKN